MPTLAAFRRAGALGTLWPMLKHRLIFGTIMVAVLVALFYFDNYLDRVELTGTAVQSLFMQRTHLPRGLLMLGAFIVLIAVASRELCDIFSAKGIDADRLMVTLAGVAGCMMMYAIPQDVTSRTTMVVFATIVIVLFLLTLLKYSWAHHRTEGAIAVAAVTMFALIYMGLLPGFLVTIRRWHSAWVVAGVLLVTKSCDIGAYCTGRAIGRHKLIPWLSPGKTWEGLAGGVAFSALVAALLAYLSNRFQISGLWGIENGQAVFIPNDFHPGRCALAGALIGGVGQFGDLVASLFKRDAGIKDSGSAIPGFGGLIDIVDSPLIVAPLAYWLLVVGGQID